MEQKPNNIMIRRLFDYLSKNWNELRLFAFYHRTVFELFFLLVYTLEQGILIYVTEINGINAVTVSYFSLIVLFTFGLHKTIMESRMKLLEEGLNDVKNNYYATKQKSKAIANAYKEIMANYDYVRE